MKKNLSIPLLLIAIFSFTNCSKQAKETELLSEKLDPESVKSKTDNKGDCRLLSYSYYDAINDFTQVDQFSYENEKVDEWVASYGSLFKMEYDGNNKLKFARMYDGETLINTIEFLYTNDKVTKEIWYEGNTAIIADEVINTYNKKNELIRNESLNYDYYVIYTYTNDGNLQSWLYYSGGLPAQKAEYTQSNKFRNPYRAIAGIEYAFPYINSGFGAGKNWYSGEKITLYDEEGNPTVYYDQDPMKTSWLQGPKNYPSMASYIDRIGGGSIINTFEYENCQGSQNVSQNRSFGKNNGRINNKSTNGTFKTLLK